MSVILHWKDRLVKDQGKLHNKIAMDNWKQCVGSKLNLEEAKIRNDLKKLKEKFKQLFKKGQEIRDREPIEMHSNDVNKDSEVNKKRKKEVTRKIKK